MRPDLLWLTNISTPYTVPVWRELAKHCHFVVACMANEEANRHWDVDTSQAPVTILACASLTLNYETRLYLPNWRLVRLLFSRPRTVVIDGWESPAGLTAFMLAKVLRCTTVVSYWSTAETHRFSRGPVSWLRRGVFRWADLIYTPGTAARRAAVQSGAAESNVVRGFPTIDTSVFHRRDTDPQVPPEDAFAHRYIYVGQLIERKNVSTLLGAFADASDDQDTLCLVGDGPELGRLIQLSADLALSNRVEFLGHLQPRELRAAYAQSDTLVLPSTTEVWGLVVNEALHCGLRVVVSDRCGVAADAHSWPGVVVTGTTRPELADALKRIRTVPRPGPGHPVEAQTPQALAQFLADAILTR